MDLISLYYFTELAKDLHMTRTASRLFISQQTLSNHIQRLERYYQVSLFHRKPALSLTTAGEFVLAFAEDVLKEHANLKDILSDLERQERGVLRFGASTLRLGMCLPAVLPPAGTVHPPLLSLAVLCLPPLFLPPALYRNRSTQLPQSAPAALQPRQLQPILSPS